MSQQENTPKFIKQVPWYAQNSQGKKTASAGPAPAITKQVQQWYDRGKKGFQSTGFRKGACTNCGAMGHNRKQCTQRPRKVAAKFTQKNIAPDDLIKDINFDWESKRDRWNGYAPQMYKQVIKQYEQFEEIRKKKRLQQGNEDPDQQFKESLDAEELSNLPTKHAKNKKYQGLAGVRNREDMAKYLLNLDVNSDHFDPKSRSMRSYDNVASQLDNLDVQSQRQQLMNQDKFASDQVQLNHSQLNTSALPTMTQKIYKTFKQKTKNQLGGRVSNESLKKYGDLTQNNKPLDIIYENDQYYEYNDDENQAQKISKNVRTKNIVKSRYEEDVMINDHLSVWGSWYSPYLGWGYDCCHNTTKYSYCLGNKGKQKALLAELKVKAQQIKKIQELQELQEQRQKQDQNNNDQQDENK